MKTLEFVKNEFLTHATNVDLGSEFFEGLGSTQGPGLIYEECIYNYF